MKRNILYGMLLISALALGSCSTTKLASDQQKKDDDVYFSNAKAGDAPEYVASTQPQISNQSRYNNYNDDDYYYYDSYASRINRFGYFSPFGYYDDIYTGYYPGFYSPYYSGLGLSLGWGGYYGYSPYSFNPFYSGYGYGGYLGYGYGGYLGYNYYGIGYGYGGGGGYWGGVSSYRNSGTPRPYRGSGAPSNAMVSRSTRPIGYNGNYPVNSNYPGRPVATNSYSGRQGTNSNTYNNSGSRPVRNDSPQPTYTPRQTQTYSPPPSNSGSSSSNSGGGSSSGGGGGGARPVRP